MIVAMGPRLRFTESTPNVSRIDDTVSMGSTVQPSNPTETDMATDNILSLIEYMPAYLRASHEAAGNRGIYPHNGAERVIVSGPVDPTGLSDWARIVREGDAEMFSQEACVDMYSECIPADALSENDLADIDD